MKYIKLWSPGTARNKSSPCTYLAGNVAVVVEITAIIMGKDRSKGKTARKKRKKINSALTSEKEE